MGKEKHGFIAVVNWLVDRQRDKCNQVDLRLISNPCHVCTCEISTFCNCVCLCIPKEPRTHEIAGTWKNTMFSQKTRCFWFSMFSDLFAISHAIMILIIFDMIHLILSPCIPKPWVYTSTEHYTKPFWPPGVNRKCKMLQQLRMECMGLHLAHAESDVSN